MNSCTLLSSFIMGTILLVCGCTGPALGPAALTDDRQMQQHARDYWIAYNVPPIQKAAQKKVAVAEFNVEFVTERLELSVDGKGDSFVAKYVDYGDGLKMELPGMLYSMLQEEGNMNLVAMDAVNEANAYARLTGTRMGEPLPPYRLTVVGSDVGRPKEACLYTTYGLRAIDPRQKDVESVLKDLLNETGADAVLRIRLRVGVYQGHATIERGSVICLTGRSRMGDIESIRSLVGEELVVSAPAKGEVTYQVDSSKFRQSIRRLVVPYLKMAVMATRE